MIKYIVKRNGRIAPFEKEKITMAILQAAVAVGGRDKKTAENITENVIINLEANKYSKSYPSVEEIQDLVEKTLIKQGHAKTAKAYILYRYEHELKRTGKKSLTYSSDNIPYKKLWDALNWSVNNNCIYLEQINTFIKKGCFADLVKASEEFYSHEIKTALSAIRGKISSLKIIIIAGPSSSGKTTTTIKIREGLKDIGFNTLTLNIDNYFFDLATHPKDSTGDYDFETPQAIDLELLRLHLEKLCRGEKILSPVYNFKTGKREPTYTNIKPDKTDIILIDSLHGMHNEMTEGIPEESKFKLYTETLSQIKDNNSIFVRWADIRLLRRIMRDSQFRNTNPEDTIKHWHYVRRSELRYIVSRIKHTDAVVNSFLAYELPIMKHKIGNFFDKFINEHKNIEHDDAVERAKRLSDIFKQLTAWEDESIVPDYSLLREFIGNSRYSY